jgi:hypothetical protein
MSLPISIGSGATVATEIIGGAHYGFNKIVGGQSGATIGWKVNADGSGQVVIGGNVTLSDPKSFIGLTSVSGFENPMPVSGTFWQTTQPVSIGNVTLDPGSQTQLIGNVTISDSKKFIGLVSVSGFSNPLPVTFSGNVTIDSIASAIATKGNVTLDAGSLTGLTGNVTISDSKKFIGLVSVSGFANPLPVSFSGNVTIDSIANAVALKGNLTLSDSKGFIGLTTAVNGQAWPDPKSYIGLVTITGSLSAAAGNITLDPGSQTQLVGNVTISDSKKFIGLVSVSGFTSPLPVTFSGNMTIDSGNISLKGNVTLSDSKGFIGLVTVGNTVGTTFSGNVTLDAGSFTGLKGTVTIQDGGNSITIDGNVGITGNVSVSSQVAWPDPKTFIGLVTIGNTVSTTFAGNVTLDAGSKTGLVGTVTIQDGGNSITIDGNVGVTGNVTISDSKGFIGLVTVVQASTARTFAGNITLDAGSKTGLIGTVTIQDGGNSITTDIIGNVTISDSKGFIGLVTLGGGTAWADPKGYIGLVTITGSLAAAAGNITLDAGSKTQIVGNITLTDPKTYIGLVTTTPSAAWPDPKGYIGLVTITGSLAAAAGNITLDAGSKTGIVGNVTLSPSINWLGFATVDIQDAWADPKTYIGLTTVTLAPYPLLGGGAAAGMFISTASGSAMLSYIIDSTGHGANVEASGYLDTTIYGNVTISAQPAWTDPKTWIGLVTVSGIGGLTLVDSKLPIGTVSVLGGKISIIGNLTLSNSNSYIGLVTSTMVGLVTTINVGLTTLAPGPNFIGLVTAWSRNAGSAKTMYNLPIALSAGSIATIAVPTGGNALFYITQNLINSDATVRVSIKSGVTYLTGNASIGITLNPGGGWVEDGGVDAPNYIGLASGAAIVIEKFDMTATSAKVGGKIMYFQE